MSSGVTETCSITGAGGQVNRIVRASRAQSEEGAQQSLSRVLRTKRSRRGSQQLEKVRSSWSGSLQQSINDARLDRTLHGKKS